MTPFLQLLLIIPAISILIQAEEESPFPPPPAPHPQLDPIFNYIEDHTSEYIEQLGIAVGIPNVSAWGRTRATYTELWNMITFVQDKLIALGFTVKLTPVGANSTLLTPMDDGMEEPLPPVILASLGSSPAKKTLLIYGHLDVQPAKRSDGWDSDPFTLTPRDGALFGRGSTDDKGPVMGWIHAIQAFIWTGIELPVNIKLILESGEETNSIGLEAALKDGPGSEFLIGVDMVAISDDNWVGVEGPCITYGARGSLPYEIIVTGGTRDLHSGDHGGAIKEPLDDLLWILGSLKGPQGFIADGIPGVMEDVMERSPEEGEAYSQMNFSLEGYRNGSGMPFLLYPESKEDTLMARWRYPSLTVHGVEGAWAETGFNTVIPSRVRGKFSVRIVPNQNADKVGSVLESWLRAKWEERHSPHRFEVKPLKFARPWLGERNHWNFRAATAAVKRIYGQDPQYIRGGGSIPVIIVLEELTGKNVVLIPMGQSDDAAHGQNEKISIRNYIQGTKVFAAYFMELGKDQT